MYDDLDYYDNIEDDGLDDFTRDDFEYQEQDLDDSYEMELEDIDRYWDRENEYIQSSGIYTEDEIQQILEDHERYRNEKKEAAKEDYRFQREMLMEDKRQAIEDAEFEREMAAYDREQERESRRDESLFGDLSGEEERDNIYYPYEHVRRPSFLQRALAFTGGYILFKKLFNL